MVRIFLNWPHVLFVVISDKSCNKSKKKAKNWSKIEKSETYTKRDIFDYTKYGEPVRKLFEICRFAVEVKKILRTLRVFSMIRRSVRQ